MAASTHAAPPRLDPDWLRDHIAGGGRRRARHRAPEVVALRLVFGACLAFWRAPLHLTRLVTARRRRADRPAGTTRRPRLSAEWLHRLRTTAVVALLALLFLHNWLPGIG